MRVFVIVDDPAARSRLTGTLQDWGHEAVPFSRAAVCRRCHCLPGHVCADAVIVDVATPGLTGLDFVARQRLVGCTIENFALVSDDWDAPEETRARSLGCRAFRRPAEADGLQQWLDDCERGADPGRVLESGFLREAARRGVEPDPG